MRVWEILQNPEDETMWLRWQCCDHTVVCSVFMSPFGIDLAHLKPGQVGTKKVPGTIHNICPVENQEWRIELSRVDVMGWKSANQITL